MQNKLIEDTQKIILELKKDILEKEKLLNELIKQYQEISGMEFEDELEKN